MTIYKLVSFFEFNLILSSISHLNCTIKCRFALGFDDIITMVGFINQYAHEFLRNFYDTAANCKIIELCVRINLLIAYSQSSWPRHSYKWLMTWKNSDVTINGWNHYFIDITVELFAKQSYKF